MNESESKQQPTNRNPWWAYVIFFGFNAFFIGAMFVEDLRKYLILGVTVFGGLCSLFFVAAGVFIFWTRLSAQRRYRPVEAVILSKGSSSKDIPDLDYETMRVMGPVIEYEYRVGGATYRCRAATSGTEEMRSGGWAERVLARYEVGQTVEAYYNPEDPSEAFLVSGDYGITPFMLVIIGAGGLGLLAIMARAFGVLLPFCTITGTITVAIAAWLFVKLRSAVGEHGQSESNPDA